MRNNIHHRDTEKFFFVFSIAGWVSLWLRVSVSLW